MNEKKLKLFSGIYTVLLLAAMLGIVLCFVRPADVENSSLWSYLNAITLMFTSAFGAYYLLDGCKKGECSKYYVFFMGACAVCDLIAIGNGDAFPPLGAILLAVAVAAYTVLCFAKDLGHTRSAVFAAVALAANAVVLLLPLLKQESLTVYAAVAFVHAAVAQFMVSAKYYDKQLRGSK